MVLTTPEHLRIITRVISLIKRVLKLNKYQPLNKIEISQARLISNLKYLLSKDKSIAIAPVLKGNAYGHGALEIARVIDSEFNKLPYFCVDSLFEAFQLLRLKLKTKILITGYIDPENLKHKSLPFSYTIWDLEQARAINKYQKGAGVHVFVDTGLNREGVGLGDLADFLREIREIGGIKVEGLMSHLASSHKEDPYAKLQLENFEQALKICQGLGINPKWKHVAASGGYLKGFTKNTNMTRIGRSIYGIDPNSDNQTGLNLILTLKTKVIQIKKISKGSKIGYEGTYLAKKDLLIGILPIGYSDGVDRRLSNTGWVQVKGVFCPILGRISMNVTTVDLSNVEFLPAARLPAGQGRQGPKIGDEVVIFSNNREDKNSIENAAKLCQTLPHDLLVHLNPNIRREIA